MWDLNGLAVVNALAYSLAEAGLPERESVEIATDPRKQERLHWMVERQKVFAALSTHLVSRMVTK